MPFGFHVRRLYKNHESNHNQITHWTNHPTSSPHQTASNLSPVPGKMMNTFNFSSQYWESPDEILSSVCHVCAMFDQYNSSQNGTPSILKCHQHGRITKHRCAVSPTPECVWDTVIPVGLWNVSCFCNYSPASGGLPLQGNFLFGGRQLRHDKHAEECLLTSEQALSLTFTKSALHMLHYSGKNLYLFHQAVTLQ